MLKFLYKNHHSFFYLIKHSQTKFKFERYQNTLIGLTQIRLNYMFFNC